MFISIRIFIRTISIYTQVEAPEYKVRPFKLSLVRRLKKHQERHAVLWEAALMGHYWGTLSTRDG